MHQRHTWRIAFGTGLALGGLGLAGCTHTAKDRAAPEQTGGGAMQGMTQEGGGEHAAMGHEMQGTTSGLTSAAHGHRLVVERSAFPVGRQATFSFRIVGPNGRAVRRFAIDQTKRMHLIVVRRDLTRYQHLHPTMDSSGTWSVPLTLPAPGRYRAFADFVVEDMRTVLRTDLRSPGAYRPAALPAPRATSTVDGYSVRLARADALRAQAEEQLSSPTSTALHPPLGSGAAVATAHRDPASTCPSLATPGTTMSAAMIAILRASMRLHHEPALLVQCATNIDTAWPPADGTRA